MKFHISKKSKISNARIGFLETPHGVVETPSLVPVATQAVVKTMTSEEVVQTKTQLLIANTFHLHLKPGEQILAKVGGVHEFMHWKKPLMTDSGGFQVFSLGFGRDFGTGKILKEKNQNSIDLGAKPQHVKITQDGVEFRSPIDGVKLFLGPKESIAIQEKIGADIIFAFDECTSPIANHAYTKRSLEKTHRWAEICLKAKKTSQALYGIVQGGKFKDLRKESAEYIGSLDFDGFGIGGEFGDDKRAMPKMLGWVMEHLPEKKPRHLLGIGHIEDMRHIIKAGVDTFDCTAPTHYARRGVAFTSKGRIDLRQAKWMKKREPLDPNCVCPVCLTYKKDYLSHLIRAHEITPLRLLTFHNLHYFNTIVEQLREEIKQGKL